MPVGGYGVLDAGYGVPDSGWGDGEKASHNVEELNGV